MFFTNLIFIFLLKFQLKVEVWPWKTNFFGLTGFFCKLKSNHFLKLLFGFAFVILFIYVEIVNKVNTRDRNYMGTHKTSPPAHILASHLSIFGQNSLVWWMIFCEKNELFRMIFGKLE